MKKLLPVLILLIIISLGNGMTKAQSPRLQLFEYFDNASIPPAYSADAYFDSLANANTDKMIFIKYHVAWGSQTGTDPMNLQNPSQVATRVTYYAVTFDPNGLQDGGVTADSTFNSTSLNENPNSFTQSDIDARDTVSSPFTVSVSHDYSVAHDTIHTHTTIKKTGTTTGTLRAYVVVIEKMIHFLVAPGESGDTYFRNVMKKMLPTAGGSLMPTMNIGDSIVYNLDWKLADVYDTTQLAVVSFVQNINNEVYQAGYSAPTVQVNDAGIYSVNVTPSFSCDSIAPVVVLRNYGTVTLTTCTIDYQIDSLILSTFSWSGNLAPDSSTNIIFPKLFVRGYHKLTVYTSNPNGSPDYVTYNDTSVTRFANASVSVPAPLTEGFENSFPPTNWAIGNSTADGNTWHQANVGGFGNSSKSAGIAFYNIIAGVLNDLYIPALDFGSSSNSVNCTFDVAYARYNSLLYDSLQVNVSTDCGATWATVYSKGNTSLATASDDSTTAFVPDSSQWRLETIDLTSYNGQADVQLQFRGISGFGNNLYIDNVDVGPPASIANLTPANYLTVYPNPGVGNLTVQSGNVLQNGTINLFSIEGQNVMQLNNLNGNKFYLNISNLEKGIYFMRVMDAQSNTVGMRKIVLQ